MRSLGTMGLFLALLVVAGFLYFNFKYPTYRWHQKITVIVETPEGEKSGSSVTAVEWSKGFNLSMGWNNAFRGEAVVVDLEERGYLFALLRRSTNYEWLGSVAPASISGRRGRPLSEDLFDEVADRRGRAKGIITVPDFQFPLLVTFTDIADPTTVKPVDPADLATSFGPGVRLKSITLEITDGPITNGKVEGVLGWLAQAEYIIPPKQQPRYAKDQTVEQKLMPSDFIEWKTLREKREGMK